MRFTTLHLSQFALIAALAWVLAACQPVRPLPAEQTPAASSAPALSTAEQAMAEASTAFVAAAQTLAPDALTVLSVEAVEWPSAALGCPQPDMVYAAVITPGYRIVLETGETRYIVHTDSRLDGEKLICPEE